MRLYFAIAFAAVALPAAAQNNARSKKPWTPPKTAWGDPDLQGIWPGTDMIGTPLERPASFGERATLTEDEFNRKVELAKKQEEIDTAPYV